MSKSVQMLVQISGTHDGEDWPEPGKTVELPDSEADRLIEHGLAREPKSGVETATAPTSGLTTASFSNEPDSAKAPVQTPAVPTVSDTTGGPKNPVARKAKADAADPAKAPTPDAAS